MTIARPARKGLIAFARRHSLRGAAARRLALCAVIIALAGCVRMAASSPVIPDQDGQFDGIARSVATVDLRHVDFARGEVVLIPARWDFYWQQYLEPADFRRLPPPIPDAVSEGMRPWTNLRIREPETPESPGSNEMIRLPARGFATYRMNLLLPPGRDYGFRIQQQFVAFRVFANGELVVNAGRAGTSRETTEGERVQHSFYTRSDESGVELILHVANYHLFRGGLRGALVIGEAPALATYVNRKIAFDLMLLGFFVAVFLYHLALFAMHPRETSFLLFSILCLSFAIRVPFMSEKIVNLIVPDSSWELSLRIVGSMNILSPALMMTFLRSVFPDAVSRKAVWPYVIVSVPLLGLHFFDIGYLAPVMFVLYLIVILPMLSHSAYITLRMSFRGSVGARVMAAGFLLCFILGFFAMYLNWRAADAGLVALLAFASLVLLQSIGLGQNYRDSLDAREKLRTGLVRSREALAAQRKDLEINLHDSLGGALTDLQVLIDRRREDLDRGRAFDAGSFLSAARERLDQMGRLFRGQLLFMEDLELTARDPLIGLRMVLLRRYSDAQREIDFEMASETVPLFQRAMADDRWRMDLLQLTRELCTNDLKYGAGTSHWQFQLRKSGRVMEIEQSNRLAQKPGEPSVSGEETRAGEAPVDDPALVHTSSRAPAIAFIRWAANSKRVRSTVIIRLRFGYRSNRAKRSVARLEP